MSGLEGLRLDAIASRVSLFFQCPRADQNPGHSVPKSAPRLSRHHLHLQCGSAEVRRVAVGGTRTPSLTTENEENNCNSSVIRPTS